MAGNGGGNDSGKYLGGKRWREIFGRETAQKHTKETHDPCASSGSNGSPALERNTPLIQRLRSARRKHTIRVLLPDWAYYSGFRVSPKWSPEASEPHPNLGCSIPYVYKCVVCCKSAVCFFRVLVSRWIQKKHTDRVFPSCASEPLDQRWVLETRSNS